jgi:hypothetical protein
MANFPCFKCNGTGQVSFRHIENGVCFQCNGTGTLAYSGRKDTFKYEDKPGFPVLSETERCTIKQWEFLDRLTGENSDKFRKVLKTAGCPHATQVYVSKAVMSRAIDLAKRVAA